MFVNELWQGGIRALIAYDSTLFDTMSLPTDGDGNTVATLADIVDHILFKYGDTPLFCPEPSVMKFYIAKWSARRVAQWNRFYAAISEEYDPLENYDRHEKTDDDLTYGHKIVTNNKITHGLTTESQVSADNAATYQPDTKAINSGNDQTNGGETHSGKDQRDYESRIHGNIGVTTSQQMLASELDLIPRLDLIDFIADDFREEFCLYVYNY